MAGAVTAVSRRAWSWPLIRWLAAVPSAPPTGSRMSETAYSSAATTSAATSRCPAADDMPSRTAPGMAPTTKPSAPTTSGPSRVSSAAQASTAALSGLLDSHSSRNDRRPLSLLPVAT